MVLSYPDLPYLPWTSKKDPKSQYPTDTVEPWCFSHWPGILHFKASVVIVCSRASHAGAGCFITHSAASRTQKNKIVELFGEPFERNYEDIDTLFIVDD